ncbi:MAG: orotidine-5'-phosphate decarboxylase [Alphaproteobacteria bacterium]|nr:orotidine-5'-phosphate decarboxylase [Alphaproteobacteria bacterium]
MTRPDHPRDRLIVALDVPTVAEARELVRTIGDEATFYKVGLELILTGGAFDNGLALVGELVDQGKRVFLDAKLLDIGNTVERSVARVAELGASFLTIHGHDRKTMKAAIAGRGTSDLKLLAVTVLTSLNADDLAEQGIGEPLAASPADLVLHRARMAHDAGLDGVISSGQEAAKIRAATGGDFLIVTPGIRLPGSDAGDQQRIMTPHHAISAGADYIVVGRPINAASDPKAAVATFVRHIAERTA